MSDISVASLFLVISCQIPRSCPCLHHFKRIFDQRSIAAEVLQVEGMVEKGVEEESKDFK